MFAAGGVAPSFLKKRADKLGGMTLANDPADKRILVQPGRNAFPLVWQNQPCCLEITLPPLGVVYLKPER